VIRGKAKEKAEEDGGGIKSRETEAGGTRTTESSQIGCGSIETWEPPWSTQSWPTILQSELWKCTMMSTQSVVDPPAD
jgi:hypothetical protein